VPYLDVVFECVETGRLELWPLPPKAAAALPEGREEAAQIIGARLAPDWPARDLLDVLPMQAATSDDRARFGVWVIVHRQAGTVIGDIGFAGPPQEGSVEIGYSVVPQHRRRGYATDAAEALIGWVENQPNVSAVLARCDEGNLPSIRTLERLAFSRAGQADGQIHWHKQSEPT
jgi:[ribosomal protein S5]-alanine N-acetyltransferase